MLKKKITSLPDAIKYVRETIETHPERNIFFAEEAVIMGERRKYPVIYIQHLAVPDDISESTGELEFPEVILPDDTEGNLAREIMSKLGPLNLMNPICACFGLGEGPGTLATCFGITLSPDSQTMFTKTLEQILAEPIPDPETSGLLAEIRKRIKFLKDNTPEWFKISRPDTQGPYNIANAIIGEEALISLYTAPEKFQRLMARITDFWIKVIKNLNQWVGEERMAPWDRLTRICECSVNCISAQMYKEHVLPHDVRIAGTFGSIDVHTCSGPHVFQATLENIPNIAATEAGFIECASAGCTSVDMAEKTIRDRPIILRIGQELPPGGEYGVIKKDIDRYQNNPRLLFSYTGMHWRKRDRHLIRDIHRSLDAYWADKFGNGS